MAPTIAPHVAGIRSVELEIAGNCNLRCSHCCTDSSPTAPAGTMTRADWDHALDDIAAVGIPAVQFIGGEPTLSPDLLPLIDRALELGLAVEVYSNLVIARPGLWARLQRRGVSLATSWYSDDPNEHERITGGRGAYSRSLFNIRKAVAHKVPVRVGMVEVIEGQRIAEGAAQMQALGITNIRIDRTRAVGRAAATESGPPAVSELCGRCYRERAAIGPNGDVYGCILSRDMPTGNVRTTPLYDILTGAEWADARAAVPPATAACPPDDSNDCDPANTEACSPAYDDVDALPAPALLGGVAS
ncbi:radical SAM protein [Streptomyces sp. NPDC059853]|uniref:radical SAM protein n=1 Tax=Streptomyces sp. NPDC059853 TaxID=3346973 RepID=UPI00364A49A7